MAKMKLYIMSMTRRDSLKVMLLLVPCMLPVWFIGGSDLRRALKLSVGFAVFMGTFHFIAFWIARRIDRA